MFILNNNTNKDATNDKVEGYKPSNDKALDSNKPKDSYSANKPNGQEAKKVIPICINY